MKKILNIVGSLRKDSYNQKIADEVQNYLKDKVEVINLEYSEVPLFNEDIEFPAPESVKKVRETFNDVDGVIFYTPEYNLGYSAAIKNIIDWISRPVEMGGERLNLNKPTLVMGATQGVQGTVTAQEQLRQVLTFLGFDVLGQPRVTISRVQTQVDKQGQFKMDEGTYGFVTGAVDALVNKLK